MSKLTLKDRMKEGMGGGFNRPPLKRDNPLEPSSPMPISFTVRPNTVQQPSTKQEERKTKADIFTERVTLVLSTEQRETAESIAKKIQRNGIKKPERVTSNTVMRCVLNLLKDFDGDIETITNEEDLNRVFRSYFLKKD